MHCANHELKFGQQDILRDHNRQMLGDLPWKHQIKVTDISTTFINVCLQSNLIILNIIKVNRR